MTDRIELIGRVVHDSVVGDLTVGAGSGAAHLDEPELRDDRIVTTDGAVGVTTLRRGRDIADLPGPQPGVLYLVPRLTARAAWDRDDLVFVYEQYRNEVGQVAGGNRLARYERPKRRLIVKWLGEKFSKLKSLLRRRPGPSLKEFGIAVLVAAGTALASGVLGVVPDAFQDGFAGSGPRLWSAGLLAVLAGIAFGLAYRLYAARRSQQRDFGTAYVIVEEGRGWKTEKRESFLATIGRKFESVLFVLKVKEVDPGWDWPHDDRAKYWDARLEIMISAFKSVHAIDADDTDNAVFVWAYWPVALAFAARSTARHRGLSLTIWQRPSFGRGGFLQDVDWDAEAHKFRLTDSHAALDEVMPAADHQTLTGPVNLVLRAADAEQASEATTDAGILLVRVLPQRWGELDAFDWNALGDQQSVSIADQAGLGLTPGPTTMHEWRCINPVGAPIDWAAYPALAREIVDWIATTVSEDSQRTWLVGMLVPAEVALGVGMLATQLGDRWPRHLWPINFEARGTPLVVPRLNLGRAGMDSGEREQ